MLSASSEVRKYMIAASSEGSTCRGIKKDDNSDDSHSRSRAILRDSEEVGSARRVLYWTRRYACRRYATKRCILTQGFQGTPHTHGKAGLGFLLLDLPGERVEGRGLQHSRRAASRQQGHWQPRSWAAHMHSVASARHRMLPLALIDLHSTTCAVPKCRYEKADHLTWHIVHHSAYSNALRIKSQLQDTSVWQAVRASISAPWPQQWGTHS